ncbi:hypothetical protein Mal4_56410 [Maioricimonas rarisocia]|uniref:Uncharacterized protein n=1 Tax=Maioricimonas rarisocia TaxID=2528026 RepID=A0A517ZFM1_9PLAN|nr:hypothetical protein [Maioricimonas rarisocia]QDU41275.1 hypothetical protein Mal4_56410 [Maioricimonas rarisocia]
MRARANQLPGGIASSSEATTARFVNPETNLFFEAVTSVMLASLAGDLVSVAIES